MLPEKVRLLLGERNRGLPFERQGSQVRLVIPTFHRLHQFVRVRLLGQGWKEPVLLMRKVVIQNARLPCFALLVVVKVEQRVALVFSCDQLSLMIFLAASATTKLADHDLSARTCRRVVCFGPLYRNRQVAISAVDGIEDILQSASRSKDHLVHRMPQPAHFPPRLSIDVELIRVNFLLLL